MPWLTGEAACLDDRQTTGHSTIHKPHGKPKRRRHHAHVVFMDLRAPTLRAWRLSNRSIIDRPDSGCALAWLAAKHQHPGHAALTHGAVLIAGFAFQQRHAALGSGLGSNQFLHCRRDA